MGEGEKTEREDSFAAENPPEGIQPPCQTPETETKTQPIQLWWKNRETSTPRPGRRPGTREWSSLENKTRRHGDRSRDESWVLHGGEEPQGEASRLELQLLNAGGNSFERVLGNMKGEISRQTSLSSSYCVLVSCLCHGQAPLFQWLGGQGEQSIGQALREWEESEGK